MWVVNYAEFRKNLKAVLDKTVDSHEVTIVSRSQDDDVVVLSLKDYNSWMETIYLLKSERNRTRLADAVARIENGIVETHGLIEE